MKTNKLNFNSILDKDLAKHHININAYIYNKNKSLNKVYPELNSAEIRVLKLFQHEIEIYYDDLVKLSNLTTEKMDRILVKLELMNIIIRLKGKKYQFKGLQNLLKPV